MEQQTIRITICTCGCSCTFFGSVALLAAESFYQGIQTITRET